MNIAKQNSIKSWLFDSHLTILYLQFQICDAQTKGTQRTKLKSHLRIFASGYTNIRNPF